MGSWNLAYDGLNRLQYGVALTGDDAGLNMAWTYDAFGNRLTQTPSGNTQALVPTASTLHYDADNRIAGLAYDAAGNLTDDGTNQYLYDGEGRVCAVYRYRTPTSMTEYIYDPIGNRVAKGSITTFSCNSITNGFVFTNLYVNDMDGRQAMETSGWNYMLHSNFFLYGQLLATTDGTNWYYNLNDWLGTKRVVANGDGSIHAAYASLPYGDGQAAVNYWGQDDTEHHFTGKVRDEESGNDYFGERYYASSMGRWMSPDPIWVKDDRLADPQRLNLYSYVRNNPLTLTDAHGADVTLGQCALGGAQKCFQQVQAGLAEADRSHIHLVAGDGTNGFGGWPRSEFKKSGCPAS